MLKVTTPTGETVTFNSIAHFSRSMSSSNPGAKFVVEFPDKSLCMLNKRQLESELNKNEKYTLYSSNDLYNIVATFELTGE